MARPGLIEHPKFKRLVYLLHLPEPYVLGLLEFLWRVGYQCGDPRIGDSLDVELVTKWPGEPGQLCQALLDCGGPGRAGFIEPVPGEDNVYQIHDLHDHAPDYVKARYRMEKHRRRGKRAKKNVAQPLRNSSEPSVAQDRNGYASPAPAPAPAPAPSTTATTARATSTKTAAVAAAVVAVVSPEEEASLIAALEARGLSHALARRHASASADPALLREILGFHDATKATLRNPVGALRSMLQDSARWGFERTPSGWVRPPACAPPGGKVETTNERLTRIREQMARERAATEAQRAQAARPPPGGFGAAMRANRSNQEGSHGTDSAQPGAGVPD